MIDYQQIPLLHMLSRFETSASRTIWLTLLIAICSLLLPLYAPEHWAWENNVLENFQMILLLIAGILCLTAKTKKELFRVCAAIVLLLMLREVNFGRALLWSTSGEMFHSGPPQDYLKWRDIPNGKIIKTCMHVVAFSILLITLCRRANIRQLSDLLLRTRIPLWDILFLVGGVVLGIAAEKAHLSFMLEEAGEIIIYTALASALYRYTRDKLPAVQP